MTPSPVEGARGAVASFEPADGIGTLRLDDGTEVRFGATACKGFVPVVGARIELVEAKPHPRHGWRAKRVALLDDVGDHRAKVQQAYGFERTTPEQMRASATLLGGVTVLLDAPFPEREDAQNALLARLGLGHLRLRHDVRGDVTLEGIMGRSMSAFPVPAPIEARRLDRGLVGDDFDPGAAFLSLSLGVPAVARHMRRTSPGHVPPVAELAQLLSALSHLGPGIVLDQSEGLVMPSDAFRASAAETDRLDRAFTGLSVGHGRNYLRTRGLSYFAVPEVATALTADDFSEEASVLGALTMGAWHGRDLYEGQAPIFEVRGEDLTYRVSPVGPGWWLGDPRRDERDAAHHAGMWLAMAERLIMRRLAYVDGNDNSAPRHYVDVFTGLGTAMVTNGLALAPQPGGTAEEGNLRVELMCHLDRDAPIHARMLSMFGGLMHEQDGSRPYRPWDGLRNAEFPPALETIILVPHPKPVVLWPGHEVSLFQLVPVGGDEYDQLLGHPEAGERWRQARYEAKDWPSYHARFNALLDAE